MAKPEARIQALQAFLLLGAVAMAFRAGYLQIVKGDYYTKIATRQRTEHRILEAPRGVIYDRNGSPLASSLEQYHIDISGAQVRFKDSVLAFYRADVGEKVERLKQVLRSEDGDFYVHGPYTAGQVRRIRRFKGVYLQPVYRREYPSGPLARPLIGALAHDSAHGASGLERFLDSLLQGSPGETVYIKDATGRTYESPRRLSKAPVRGFDVTLTIDKELQEIAEGGLSAVFDEFSPKSADIVFLHPKTGEVLAAASREVDAAGREVASASYFQANFEPGSTAKPFTAAALLLLGRVKPSDQVAPEAGQWKMPLPNGRTRLIRDDHPQKVPLTLARTIQVSSNIGITKFASRLQPDEHFDVLRAFGFGTPTGVEFPGEVPGRLDPPHLWRPGQQGPSVAMGYAFQVTPIQLAAAYAAIANDGKLLAPTIIKEIRDPSGAVVYRHDPLVVRQAIPQPIAAQLRDFLALSAADSGTGGRAQVKGQVLGKTGTARLVVNRRYTAEYAASFAGIFPAKEPQLVVVVRVERPKGALYYGGFVAAPVVRQMLTQALAARQTTLDRGPLADEQVTRRTPAVAVQRPEARRTFVNLPLGRAPARPPAQAVVPDVIGVSPRAAAARLHQRGFRVRLEGAGVVVRSDPAPGDSLGEGRVVTIHASRERTP